MELAIKDIARHRNGVGGESFHVVLFDYDTPLRHMIAILFAEHGHCAVFDVSEWLSGNIAFAGGNSWRGDIFEEQLRRAIKVHEDAAEAFRERVR